MVYSIVSLNIETDVIEMVYSNVSLNIETGVMDMVYSIVSLNIETGVIDMVYSNVSLKHWNWRYGYGIHYCIIKTLKLALWIWYIVLYH